MDPPGIGPKWEGRRDPTQSRLGNLGRSLPDDGGRSVRDQVWPSQVAGVMGTPSKCMLF